MLIPVVPGKAAERSRLLLASRVNAMDPKYQRVALNDGHFIPALGFGTFAPDEVICAA